jgi:very-short-patch-repair endonuclease
MKINPAIFKAVCVSAEIHSPVEEFRFHPVRKWRFDFAWPQHRVALEVQGGIWGGGRHSRGAAMLKEWEKLNTAAMMGWRILYCQPRDLCMTETINTIRAALIQPATQNDRGEG